MDQAEPASNSRIGLVGALVSTSRHQAVPGRNRVVDSCLARLNVLAQVAWQAEPAPDSRRHDAAPNSRTDLLLAGGKRSRAGRLPSAALVCGKT